MLSGVSCGGSWIALFWLALIKVRNMTSMPWISRSFGLVFSCFLNSVYGQPSGSSTVSPARVADPCAVKELKKSEVQGLRVYAPDGSRYLVNQEDEEGVDQIYVGQGHSRPTCITCVDVPHGPKRKRMKMQPHWHPSGRWIFLAVERDKYKTPPIVGWSRKYKEGQLQNGLWTNIYAVSPDGKEWHRLTDFKSGVKGTADGYTGPALTKDGTKAVWSQIMDGNIFAYWPFGRWELILADFHEDKGIPKFTNLRNITPKGMNWNEPGNFHPDNEWLLFSGSDQKDAQGMDQFVLNIRTHELKNLTRSPTVWDEHGRFSPDGERIVFMSAYPYRNDPKASKVLTIRTEFMLMDKEGGSLSQLTHFREPGYPEYVKNGGIAASPQWSLDGRSAGLRRLVFPEYEYWDVNFIGNCGNRNNR